MKWLALCSVLALLLFFPGAVHAADPTPTPTLRPIPPTPTSAFLYFRNTPTPWAIGTVPPEFNLNVALDSAEVADTAINAYRWINSDHLLDMITTGMLAAVTFGLLLSTIRRGTKNQG